MEHLRKAADNGMNLMKVADRFPALVPYRDDTDFIKLALQLEKYELDAGALKDPMTGRWNRAEVIDDKGDPTLASRPDKAQQEDILRGAQIALAKIERALSQENENAAIDSYADLRKYTSQEDRLSVPRFVQEMRKINDRKEEIETRIKEIRLK